MNRSPLVLFKVSPKTSGAPERLAPAAPPPRLPTFLVRREPRLQAWREACAALLTLRAPRPSGKAWRHVEAHTVVPRRAFLASVLLHVAVLMLLGQWPFGGLGVERKAGRDLRTYDLRRVDLSAYVPALRTLGPGGRPGRGTKPDRPPALGSTAFHPRVVVVSNPPRPDNTRQTIIQSSSPPDLLIPHELRLPNILIGNPSAPKKPTFRAGISAPVRAAPQAVASPEAPQLASSSPVAWQTPVHLASQPKLTIPVGSGGPMPSAPNAPAAGAQGNVAAPDLAEAAAGEGGLLILGVDPIQASGPLALPPGNRYGAFSISPAGGQPGSPGGVPGGDPQGGTGGDGNGSGGDGSTGIGSGNAGGGGGSAGLSVPAATSGGSGHGGGAVEAVLAGTVLPPEVFPVTASVFIRRNPLVVSTGPIGGGGLRVYGVLHGGRIYTIYLPMPGRSWVLQYSLLSREKGQKASVGRNVTVQPSEGALPPDPVAKFDFRRPAVPEDKRDEVIVIYGVIDEEGTLRQLKVIQGVHPPADQAALAAFRKWQFKPALQRGKPIAVEFMVGIPAWLPGGD